MKAGVGVRACRTFHPWTSPPTFPRLLLLKRKKRLANPIINPNSQLTLTPIVVISKLFLHLGTGSRWGMSQGGTKSCKDPWLTWHTLAKSSQGELSDGRSHQSTVGHQPPRGRTVRCLALLPYQFTRTGRPGTCYSGFSWPPTPPRWCARCDIGLHIGRRGRRLPARLSTSQRGCTRPSVDAVLATLPWCDVMEGSSEGGNTCKLHECTCMHMGVDHGGRISLSRIWSKGR